MKVISIAFCLLFFSNMSFTQISINTDGTEADSSAILDVKSTSKGILLPRMTSAERSTINNPAEGLVIYNTDSKTLEFFNGTLWASPAAEFVCGDQMQDAGGNIYNTVLIDQQCWMAENMKYDQNINGDDWCYDNDPANCETYGRLYTWDAIMQGAASSNSNPSGVQGICPNGWHIPSDTEWTVLTSFLGGLSVAGGKMKETGTVHWGPPNNDATNSSLFTALPGGKYDPDNIVFEDLGNSGLWWSATQPSGNTSWVHEIFAGWGGMNRISYYDYYGYSCRCVMD